jgi:hypothetical protein
MEALSDANTVKVEGEIDGKVWSILVSWDLDEETVIKGLDEDMDRILKDLTEKGLMP